MERLSDLDELILRCRTDVAKSYIEEAVSSYRASVYRACIITTWIAVVFDIIDKLKELAMSGDSQAKLAVKEFEEYQIKLNKGDNSILKKALEFEGNILELARDKFELLDFHQFTDLNRLRDDRNRCAHPSFQHTGEPYQPSGELARTHLRNAIVDLLQKLPVQGRAALEDLKRRVESEFFPIDLTKAKEVFKESPFLHPTQALVNGFVDALIFGLFGENEKLKFKLRAVIALQAVLELQREIAEPRAKKQIKKSPDKLRIGI
jgi:hypothetical protein